MGGWGPWEDRAEYSPEVRERAVRMAFEHEDQHDSQWAAIRSVAEKCSGPQNLDSRLS